MAARRKMAAARFADGWVRLLNRRAGDLVVRRQGEPRGEVLLGGPAAYVGANLGAEPQGVVGAKAIDL
jgi:hypothetical protein